jgi:FkbM family methyltransferase
MTPEPLQKRLEEVLAGPPRDPEPLGSGPVVIYGAGGRGREMLAAVRESGRTVAACIDRQAIGEIDGVQILAPGDARVRALASDGCPVVVAVFNPAADPLPIWETLRADGFRRIVNMLEARQLMLAGDVYWLSSTAAMTPSVQDAAWLFDKLADEPSRHTLIDAIALRRTWNPALLRDPAPSEQYLPSGIPMPREKVRFVDGGAFDGDTLSQLAEQAVRFEAIAAFEPDIGNYAALCRRIAPMELRGDVSVWPCGLDSVTRQIRFHAQGLASSGMSATGDVVIQTVALDEALPRFRPTYVKLDIEGAEADALRGMARAIESSRPALAVCVYHKPADLWELPRLVDQLLPEADFFVRAHAYNGFDLVLYAVPREKGVA